MRTLLVAQKTNDSLTIQRNKMQRSDIVTWKPRPQVAIMLSDLEISLTEDSSWLYIIRKSNPLVDADQPKVPRASYELLLLDY